MMFENGKMPKQIVEEKGMVQVADESAILEFVQKALADNPQAVEELKEGKDKALNFLVGQVMRHSKGKANPAMARELIQKETDTA